MSTDPVRVTYTISLGISNASRSGEFTINRSEWNKLTPADREEYIREMYEQEIWNFMDGGWDVENADLDDPVVDD